MNKQIYMTYKKSIPTLVINRWNILNPGYKIYFSLNEDCINFLKKHFNNYIADLFDTIHLGSYKADLWRLCKLYINGGVYADVDLVPYINIDSLIKKQQNTFYTCLSIDPTACFQAFIISNSPPRNPLILNFIISFLLNKPYMSNLVNGPTHDMYNCIKYNLK